MNPIVGAVLNFAAGPLDRLLGRFVPNADDRQKAKLEIETELIKAANQANAAQIEVNKTEAQHASLFVAGWRPAVGWVCGFSLAWQYVLQPMLTWLVAVIGPALGYPLPPLPTLDTSEMMTILMGMLGLAGFRTYEKIKGEVDRSTLKEP
jgi:hypothetical protein